MTDTDEGKNTSEDTSNPPDYVPFEAFRSTIYDSDTEDEVWDTNLSLGQNILNVVNGTVWLPEQSLQTPVLCSYILTPSALSDALFILFLFGGQGTGKSDFSRIVECLHDSPIQSAGCTTYVGLRNFVQSKRWRVLNTQERNYCLIFNNLPERIFNDKPDLYNFLLIGCRRGEDLIQISKGQGENLQFRVFGLKVVNSKFPVFLNSEKFDASELKDRCLIGFFERNESFTKAIPVNSDLSFLKSKFDTFWSEPDNLHAYIKNKKALLKGWKKQISLNRRNLFAVDLIATGLTTGVWADSDTAKEAFLKFETYQTERLKGIVTPLKLIISEYVQKRLAEIDDINEELSKLSGSLKQPYEISTDQLKHRIEQAKNAGVLNIYDAKSTSVVMEELGFELSKSELVNKLVWKKV